MDTIDFLLDQDDPQAAQPENIKIQLKPHQLAALYRMSMLDRDCGMSLKAVGINIKSNIGILADLPAYGKTLTLLALVETLKETPGSFAPISFMHGAEFAIVLTKKQRKDYIPATLIVIPDNLIDHWQQHLDNYTELQYELVTKRDMHKIYIDEYNVILCPASSYNNFVRYHRDSVWNRVVFDEADSINIPNTADVRSRFLWLISSTYENIPRRRNKGFLKRLFVGQNIYEDAIKKYYYPVVVKGKDAFVKNSFSLEEPQVNFIDCTAPQFVRAIQQHISAKVLDYINAGDLNSAILSLGGNVDTDRNIIALVTRKLRNDITKLNAKLKTLDQLELDERKKAERRKEYDQKLHSLNERLTALTKSISEASSSDCTICCDTLNHPTLVPCCNNMFCASCLLAWLKNNQICPMCRGKFDPNELYTISKEDAPRRSRKEAPPKKDKIETMIDIITQNLNGRYLVFSGHSATFDKIGAALNAEDIQYGLLNTTHRTEKTLNDFRNKKISVILLNAEHNGAGLQLQEATDVILFHQMRPSLELQTIGRAQRPGRIGRLRVWKLRYSHEYI